MENIIQQLMLIIADLHTTQLHLDQKLSQLTSTVDQYEHNFREIQKCLKTSFEAHDTLKHQNYVLYTTTQQLIASSNQTLEKVNENQRILAFIPEKIEPTIERIRNRVNSHNDNINYLKTTQDSQGKTISNLNIQHDEHTNEIEQTKSKQCSLISKLDQLNIHNDNYTQKLDNLTTAQAEPRNSMTIPDRLGNNFNAKHHPTIVQDFEKSSKEKKVITRKSFLAHYRPESPPDRPVDSTITFEKKHTCSEMNTSANNTSRTSDLQITIEADHSRDMKLQLRKLQQESFYLRRVKPFEMPV